jgi:tRNA (guanine-N(7)-)-methyltransferase
MRVRKRKGAEEHLANHPQYVILEPEAAKGKWHELFGNDNPIHIEVGSGKGAFITGMAQQNPDINYIGIDIQLSVLSYALDKVLASGAENVKLLRVDGSALTNYFEDGEVDMMYLNFSDPWPKSRHEKRRLTYKTFLDTYKQILPENGEIHFKTDNRGLFEYSLASFSQYGMVLNKVWLDLHASDYEGNVMTEYERKFSEKGQVIYRVEAQFKDLTLENLIKNND